MRNMRILAIGSVFLLICLGIGCSCQQQEQTQKPGSMRMTMSSTATVNGSYSPLEVQATESEVRTENVTIKTDTLTCTADKALFKRETGQLVLTGNVMIHSADGIEFTAEEIVLKEKAEGSDT